MRLPTLVAALALYGISMAASGQPAEGTPLSTDALSALLTDGGLLKGRNTRGQLYELRLAANGSMQATSTRSNGPGQIADSGKWQVKEGALCITYTEWQGGATRCASVSPNGEGFKYGSDGADLIPAKGN